MDVSLKDGIAEILISEEEITAKVKELGEAISRDYDGLFPIIVGVLRGSAMLVADLIRNIEIPIVVDFVSVSSYGPATRSTGVVRILKDLDLSIEGRHVLIVEDIIDTGLTLNYILRMLRVRKPASLEVGTLLNKPARRLVDVRLKYTGFDLPDKFVVGYGLDYAQKYRNLPFICVLKPEIYS
jgi:hypoxanthine phosphoribosyltransferase